MKNQFALVGALLLSAAACVSPVWAFTDVFVGVDDATNLGAGFEGPQLLHYTYDSASFAYSLNGHTAMPAGTTVNNIALGSSVGASGGVYATLAGATNELREYGWDRTSNTFSNLRSFTGTHSDIVVGSDDKLYGFDSATGNLNYYTPSGATFSVGGFQTITDVGGTQQLAAHPNGSIFSSGLLAVGTDPAYPLESRMTRVSQWASGLGSEIGYFPAGVFVARHMAVTDNLSPMTNQPLLWFNHDTNFSPAYEAYKVWTFDTPFNPQGTRTDSDVTNFTLFDSMDTMSDGSMLATGYFDFSIYGGQDGNHIWAIEGGTDGILHSSGGVATDKIRCEPGSDTTSGCFKTTGGPDDKFLLSVDQEDTIHVLGAGIVGGWKYSSQVENEDIYVVAAVHSIGTLGNPTAIATGEAPPPPVVIGDYNKNLVVDAADYVLWRNTEGQSVPPGSGADGTGPGDVPDGFVDDLDYNFWRARFGNTAGSAAGAAAAAAVPEPSAAWLLILGSTLLFGCKRRM